MKRILLTVGLTVVLHTLQAQQPPQPPQQPSIEKRLKKVMEGLNKQMKLTDAQKEKLKTAYKAFFESMDKQPRPQTPPPPPVKKEVADKLAAERDKKIKAALTAEEYTQYVQIEKTLRPTPPPPPPGESKRPTPPQRK